MAVEVDFQTKVRQLEVQVKEMEAASNKLRCDLIKTKQQLCAAEQQITTHEDYKLKLEQVLSNMQVQHELIVAKLTQAGQPVDINLLSQNKMRLELQETFARTDTRVQNLAVDKEKVVYQVQQDMPNSVPVATQPETLQYPILCQGDSENEVN